MPYTCCVPYCKGNYRNGPKVHLFGFPRDEDLKQKWIHAIRRDFFTPSDYSKVCEYHFHAHEIQRTGSFVNSKTGETITYDLDRPRLTPEAVPSQMPNCKEYLSAPLPPVRKSRSQKLEEKENNELADAIRKSQEEYQQQQKQNEVLNIQDIKEKIKLNSLWKLLDYNDSIYICTLECANDKGPNIVNALTIDENLMVNAYVNSQQLTSFDKHRFPVKVNSLSEIDNITDALETLNHDPSPAGKCETDSVFILRLNLILSLLLPLKNDTYKFCTAVKFIYQQLRLMTEASMHYSYEFLIFSSLFYNVSPHAYRFLRSSGHCILPCYSTIRKITLSSSMNPSVEQRDKTFMFYIKQKFRSLSSSDTTVMLLVDEIHLKSFFDYKGGNIVGTASNSLSTAAKTVFAFMINSVFSNYKDVVHLLPTCKMTAEDLHSMIKKIVCGLEEVGFKVITVITDNNAINRKAMSRFIDPARLSIVYPHPCDQSRPLFFIFDTVHILKCVRNNWLNLKSFDKSFVLPQFQFGDICTKPCVGEYALASFNALKQLHNAECDSLVKFAYKLSYKALNPSTFEKQNVKLVLQIFNKFTAEALDILGEKLQIPHYANTNAFIKIIVTWWQIVNVKTPRKGKRSRNSFEEPLTGGLGQFQHLFL